MKNIILILFISILAINLLFSIAQAKEIQPSIAIDSPTQVKPGTSLPIYITIKNKGDPLNFLISPDSDVPGLMKSIKENKSEEFTIDSIEIFEPNQAGFEILSTNKSKVKISHKPKTKIKSMEGLMDKKQNIESIYRKRIEKIMESNSTEEEKSNASILLRLSPGHLRPSANLF